MCGEKAERAVATASLLNLKSAIGFVPPPALERLFEQDNRSRESSDVIFRE
jgi:hypothetical protein